MDAGEKFAEIAGSKRRNPFRILLMKNPFSPLVTGNKPSKGIQAICSFLQLDLTRVPTSPAFFIISRYLCLFLPTFVFLRFSNLILINGHRWKKNQNKNVIARVKGDLAAPSARSLVIPRVPWIYRYRYPCWITTPALHDSRSSRGSSRISLPAFRPLRESRPSLPRGTVPRSLFMSRESELLSIFRKEVSR